MTTPDKLQCSWTIKVDVEVEPEGSGWWGFINASLTTPTGGGPGASTGIHLESINLSERGQYLPIDVWRAVQEKHPEVVKLVLQFLVGVEENIARRNR
jgi:hypothetical protein